MDDPAGVVIVGAGQGGFQVAASLRDEGYAGRIRLLGDEPGLPYQRPPLSKAYMLGKTDAEGLELRAAAFYADRGIEVSPSEKVVRIDCQARTVTLASGDRLPYGHLVLATGARNRLLNVPGATLPGVRYLRTRAEADAIRERLGGVRRIVVIGAGFIGLEFAAVARSLGVEVTVVEALERPMARALSVPMSAHFRRAHEAAGIAFRFGVLVRAIIGHNGGLRAVETHLGEILEAELVLVGIGVEPNVELAAEAGLAVEDGVRVDGRLVTSDPRISAIGDCVSYPAAFADGAATRLESVQNAVDQARFVATRIRGTAGPGYDSVPWFWSDQGGMKLQIAGFARGHDETVLRGDPASGAFSVFCFREGRLHGVESLNKAADHMVARRLLAQHLAISAREAADTGVDLKAYVAARPALAPRTPPG